MRNVIKAAFIAPTLYLDPAAQEHVFEGLRETGARLMKNCYPCHRSILLPMYQVGPGWRVLGSPG